MQTLSNVHPVDQLGSLLAEAATLEAQIKAIKADLIASGADVVEGDIYRVSISTSERETLDMAAAKAKLSPQFLKAHTTVKTVTTVRCSARSATAKAA